MFAILRVRCAANIITIIILIYHQQYAQTDFAIGQENGQSALHDMNRRGGEGGRVCVYGHGWCDADADADTEKDAGA
jgi:hypothetical protein